MRAHLELARWLGPWTKADAVPGGVRRWSVPVPARADGERPFEAWAYAPSGRSPRGAFLVAPGLHYAGPADPRMDRFLRVLARAGFLVLCPFLPDFCALRVRPTLMPDFARAFEVLEAMPERPPRQRPGVFSISFGSLPALRLAADERYADRVGAVIPFGGYADFREVLRFCLAGGGGARPHDPLNRPVVVMNLLGDMGEQGRERVTAAWERYVKRTWGRPEMRVDGRYQRVAEEIAAELEGDDRHLFRVGTGLEEGALERCLEALDQAGESKAFLDPRPHLHGLRAPVHVFHGADDDVIPWEQLDAILAALPPHVEKARYLTGLYAHSGASALKSLPALAREGVTLVRMLAAIARAGGA